MTPALQPSFHTPFTTTAAERSFAGSVPIFINVRDRLNPLTRLLEWLRGAGHDNITLINVASSYPPLLRFLLTCPYPVVNLRRNLGPFALWMIPELRTVLRERWFVYTDADVVPADGCPLDAVAYLYHLLRRFPDYLKAGLGLCLDDLPDHYRHKQRVIAWETALYGRELMPGVFQADVDTTFALYRPHSPRSCPAMRTRGRYQVRHTPWYVDSANPDDEELYYHAHAWPVARHWRLNDENGGRPAVPPSPGGIAAQLESDPQSLLTALLGLKSGRLMRAYRMMRRMRLRPAPGWNVDRRATAEAARQAILEIMRSDDWQAITNARNQLDLWRSQAVFCAARAMFWKHRPLLPSRPNNPQQIG